MDVHAASIVAVRIIDGAKPQPPQRFKPAPFPGMGQEAEGPGQNLFKNWRQVGSYAGLTS
jgi:hypothetical protein